jgi:hypothetical protein
MAKKKLGIMQPYFFPYIGYFQLIKATDKFIFYDDVDFIKNGWINRNRILLNGNPHYITIQLKGASSFKPINEITFTDNRSKILKTIKLNYCKAPYFNLVMPFLEEVLGLDTNLVSELAIASILKSCEYLGIKSQFEIASERYSETKGLGRAERLKAICKINNMRRYINPIGGTELYKKEDFQKDNIELSFIKTGEIKYSQGGSEFVPFLSIIDVMMFNSPDEINKMLDDYELI